MATHGFLFSVAVQKLKNRDELRLPILALPRHSEEEPVKSTLSLESVLTAQTKARRMPFAEIRRFIVVNNKLSNTYDTNWFVK